MLGIFLAAFDEMLLNFAKPKLFHKKALDEIDVDAVLAGVYIGAQEVASWKGVNAYMTLGDDHNGAPSTGILDVVIRRRNNLDRTEGMHAQLLRKFTYCALHYILAIEQSWITIVPVDGQVFAKMHSHYHQLNIIFCRESIACPHMMKGQ